MKFDQGKRRNFGTSFGTKRKNSAKTRIILGMDYLFPSGLGHTVGAFVPLDRIQWIAIQVVEATETYVRPVLNFSWHDYLCDQQSIT